VKEECWVLTEGAEGEEDGGGLNGLSGAIIGAAIEVHRQLGPGMLESAYEACLEFELTARGHSVERQKALPVTYKGSALDCLFRLDMVVDGKVLVELKSVESLLPVHRAQTLSYLRLSGLPLALLINFYGPTLKEGVRRFRSFPPTSSSSASSVPSVRNS
jgi:GxxExxY protein